jgi:hypothetical protein
MFAVRPAYALFLDLDIVDKQLHERRRDTFRIDNFFRSHGLADDTNNSLIQDITSSLYSEYHKQLSAQNIPIVGHVCSFIRKS